MKIRKILLVDNYEPLRHAIRTMFDPKSFRVIGEASDGLEALEKARTLVPDIIVMDVGLRELNGIQVAARLASVLPETKFVFLSHDPSLYIAEAALQVGPIGCIHKLHIHDELIRAMETVMKGKSFVGTGMQCIAMRDLRHTALPLLSEE